MNMNRWRRSLTIALLWASCAAAHANTDAQAALNAHLVGPGHHHAIDGGFAGHLRDGRLAALELLVPHLLRHRGIYARRN